MRAMLLAVPLLIVSASDLSLTVRPGEAVPFTVEKTEGVALVDPGQPPRPELSPDFVRRSGITGGRAGELSIVGPVIVKGGFKRVGIDMAGRRFFRTVEWFGVPHPSGADAVIGPASLPFDVIRFDLGRPVPGERAVDLPLTDFSDEGQRLGTVLVLGRSPVRIFFTLARKETLATAGAGTAIAAAHGGHLLGDLRPTPIAHGVTRPTRTMRLDHPLAVGPVSIRSLSVRVADYGHTRIASGERVDPAEVVVSKRIKRDPRNDWMLLGRDALRGCSSLVMNKRRKLLTLSCR